MIGLDTTAIIDLFKGEQAIKSFLEKNKEPVATNMMNHLEVHFGIHEERSGHAREARYYDEFFNTTYFFNLTPEASRRAAAIHHEMKRKGKSVAKFDCIMAACYLEHGIAKILTRNGRHFRNIKGLQVAEY